VNVDACFNELIQPYQRTVYAAETHFFQSSGQRLRRPKMPAQEAFFPQGRSSISGQFRQKRKFQHLARANHLNEAPGSSPSPPRNRKGLTSSIDEGPHDDERANTSQSRLRRLARKHCEDTSSRKDSKRGFGSGGLAYSAQTNFTA